MGRGVSNSDRSEIWDRECTVEGRVRNKRLVLDVELERQLMVRLDVVVECRDDIHN